MKEHFLQQWKILRSSCKVNQKSLIKTIGETGGLGTVATRADVIERLFNSFVMEKKGNDIYTTSKGRQLLELVPEDLKSPALTAEWEQGLTKIANGQMKKADIHERYDCIFKTSCNRNKN